MCRLRSLKLEKFISIRIVGSIPSSEHSKSRSDRRDAHMFNLIGRLLSKCLISETTLLSVSQVTLNLTAGPDS